MRPQSRHVAIALIIALVLLAIATVAARADDRSRHGGAQWHSDSGTPQARTAERAARVLAPQTE
jgi:hypothetical protein